MRPETLPSTCPTFHDSVHHHLSVTSHQRPAFPWKRVWGKASSVANRWARAVAVFSIYGCLCGDRLWLMPEVSLMNVVSKLPSPTAVVSAATQSVRSLYRSCRYRPPGEISITY